MNHSKHPHNTHTQHINREFNGALITSLTTENIVCDKEGICVRGETETQKALMKSQENWKLKILM